MNKKLISLAVAAALVAPAAAMAEAVLYGKLNVSLDYADVRNVILPTYEVRNVGGRPTLVETAPGTDYEGWGMSSSGYIPGEGRASRLGVKGSEDLGGGLKAIYQIELGINPNDTNNNVLSNTDTISYRNTFVGLAGGWGTALMGRHDTPMKISTGKLDLFADTMADMNGTIGIRDLRADNAIAYISPSFSGFTFAAAIVPSGGATGGVNTGTTYNATTVYDVLTDTYTTAIVPVNESGLNLEEDSIAGAYSLAAIYSNGPFYASVAYESLGNEHFNTQNVSLNSSNCPYATTAPGGGTRYDCNYVGSDNTAWRIGLGLLDWNGFTLTGVYENRDNEAAGQRYLGYVSPTGESVRIPGGAEGAELWTIQAGYRFGNAMVKANYGQGKYDADINVAGDVVTAGGRTFRLGNNLNVDYDIETWAVGFDYNFSKRTTAYVLYTDVTDDRVDFVSGSQWAGFSLGMMHSF